MTKIPGDLRRALVEVLMSVPGGDDPAARAAFLLAGIPHDYFTRNPANLFGDVMLLVSQVEEIFGAKGDWCLLQLVDNALPAVCGTELGKRLQQIRAELVEVEKGLRPVQAHPAEVAQLHLFDLRRPVFTCMGLLPLDAKVSGFVVTTPTPKLLSYFCDSLKLRGAEYIWSRDEVATTGTPQVIDPKYTPVTVVVNKSDKVRSLLAKKHVIWPIYVSDATDAVAVWRKLDRAFEKTLERHLVIVFGMPTGADVPPGMVLLPAPKFTSKDISNWVGDIGKALTWHETVTERWASVILVGCAGNADDDLPIEMVYEQLELHCRCITQNRNPHDLMNALEDLELIGG
jgi:hypothetical protein